MAHIILGYCIYFSTSFEMRKLILLSFNVVILFSEVQLVVKYMMLDT